jgi:hypothetical protein
MIFLPQIQKAVLPTAFFICLTLILPGCSKTSDEKQIQLIIDEMISAVERGKPAELVEHLHENFQANRNLDISQTKRMLMMYGMQHAKISVNIVSSQTVIDPIYTDKATTTLSVVVAGFSAQGLPDDGGLRVVKLVWRKDSDWKLLKAEWE